MEGKEKIEKLIEVRNNAMSEEKKVLSALLKETKERIFNNSRTLSELVSNDLMCQANNPYQVCLRKELKFDKKELSTLLMDFLRGENEEELSTEEKAIASFRRNWIFNNLAYLRTVLI